MGYETEVRFNMVLIRQPDGNVEILEEDKVASDTDKGDLIETGIPFSQLPVEKCGELWESYFSSLPPSSDSGRSSARSN